MCTEVPRSYSLPVLTEAKFVSRISDSMRSIATLHTYSGVRSTTASTRPDHLSLWFSLFDSWFNYIFVSSGSVNLLSRTYPRYWCPIHGSTTRPRFALGKVEPYEQPKEKIWNSFNCSIPAYAEESPLWLPTVIVYEHHMTYHATSTFRVVGTSHHHITIMISTTEYRRNQRFVVPYL